MEVFIYLDKMKKYIALCFEQETIQMHLVDKTINCVYKMNDVKCLF